jgi:hypothetical protein
VPSCTYGDHETNSNPRPDHTQKRSIRGHPGTERSESYRATPLSGKTQLHVARKRRKDASLVPTRDLSGTMWE